MGPRYVAEFADGLTERATYRIGSAVREAVSCKGELNQIDCGRTVAPFHACCPRDGFCHSPMLNAYCCGTEDDCGKKVKANPQCADATWDMYDNDGYFCCEQKHKGYKNKISEGDGCATTGYVLKSGEEWLDIVVAGKDLPSSSTTGSSASPTGSTDPSQTSGSPATTTSGGIDATGTGAPSYSNTGAVAGGVVGGIAAIAIIAGILFWLWRRKKARSYVSGPKGPPGFHPMETGPERDTVPLQDLPKQDGASELPGKESRSGTEVELHGQDGKEFGPAELYSRQSPHGSIPAELHGHQARDGGPSELNGQQGLSGPIPRKEVRSIAELL